MVTTPEEDRLRQARELISDIAADGLTLSAIVINRFLDERTWRESVRANGGQSALRHLAEIGIVAGAMTDNGEPRPQLDALGDYLGTYRDLALKEIERVAAFARELPSGVKLAIAPEIDFGVRDLGALARVADYLTGGSAVLRTLETAAARIRTAGAGGARRRGAH
jgi:hypothetical protein